MSIQSTQVIAEVAHVIKRELEVFAAGASVQEVTKIPPTSKIRFRDDSHWLKVRDVICVYVDMTSSTRLSASRNDRQTARAYQLFTGTAVEIFHVFDASYIDVRGDGVFALFNGDQVYRALAAAVSFKTFAHEEFGPAMKKFGIETSSHIGIDQKTVLVKKIGLSRLGNRTDRQNEVWAGKPVNMASKLASMGAENELHVSDRFFSRLEDERALMSCGCGGNGKSKLWSKVDVSDLDQFDFDLAYLLKSCWCSEHGKGYCEALLELDV